jgi:hypothetical protein
VLYYVKSEQVLPEPTICQLIALLQGDNVGIASLGA